MKTITDHSLNAERTHGGWVGELEDMALSDDQRADLAALANIKESKRRYFYDCVDSINLDFRQDAVARIVFKKRFGAEKPAKTLRDSKDEIARLAHELADALDMLGVDLFCELADESLESLHLHKFYNRLVNDLTNLEVICVRATVEVRRGKDTSMLQQYLVRWAHLYEEATGRSVGISKNKEGNPEGAFLTTVRRFFEFQPSELRDALGINPLMLTKAIFFSLKDRQSAWDRA